jgi:hypothetical protein
LYQLAGSNSFPKNKKLKKGDHQTLEGNRAFDAEKDGEVCKAKALSFILKDVRIPKRAHHVLCIKNTKSKGKGALSDLAMAGLGDDKRYKEITGPIRKDEMFSSKNITKEAAQSFFEPCKTIPTIPTSETSTIKGVGINPQQLCKAVTALVNDNDFCEKHKKKGAPLAMIALAQTVMKDIVNADNGMERYFQGITMLVPDVPKNTEPHYHSIVGQKLLLVDWIRFYGSRINCPESTCNGTRTNVRTQFSKSQTLFPIFSLEGPPSWCMVQVMKCGCCGRTFDANSAAVLVRLPQYVSSSYPLLTDIDRYP